MLTISPIYAGLLGALLIFLAYRVVTFRRSESLGLGDEGASNPMKRAIRAHANAMEYIPIGLILLLMLELNHLTPWLLHILGLVFLIARVLHAQGMSTKNGPSFGRFYGTLFTWISIIALAVLNIVVVVTR